MRVEHWFVDAGIAAFGTFERLGIEVIARVIFQVVFVLGDERAVRAGQQFLSFDVSPGVFPEIQFGHGDESALRMLALVRFQFTLSRHSRHSRITHFQIVHSYRIV